MPAWIGSLLKYGGFGSGVIIAVLVVYFAIAKPMREDFVRVGEATTKAMTEVVNENRRTREEFIKFRSEFTEWTRQVFVSRDLYDQRRAETDRSIADLKDSLKELRASIKEGK